MELHLIIYNYQLQLFINYSKELRFFFMVVSFHVVSNIRAKTYNGPKNIIQQFLIQSLCVYIYICDYKCFKQFSKNFLG